MTLPFDVLQLLFPAVLAIHNLDEYCRRDDFTRAFQSWLSAKHVRRSVIRDAAILLTLAVTTLCVLTYLYRSAALLTLSKIAIFALMLNAVGHCFLSLKRRTLVPGTISAVALVLPYSILAITIMRTNLADSTVSLFFYAACGALAAPLAIMGFLIVSYCCFHSKAHADD
jgi:hypothetical protein